MVIFDLIREKFFSGYSLNQMTKFLRFPSTYHVKRLILYGHLEMIFTKFTVFIVRRSNPLLEAIMVNILQRTRAAARSYKIHLRNGLRGW